MKKIIAFTVMAILFAPLIIWKYFVMTLIFLDYHLTMVVAKLCKWANEYKAAIYILDTMCLYLTSRKSAREAPASPSE